MMIYKLAHIFYTAKRSMFWVIISHGRKPGLTAEANVMGRVYEWAMSNQHRLLPRSISALSQSENNLWSSSVWRSVSYRIWLVAIISSRKSRFSLPCTGFTGIDKSQDSGPTDSHDRVRIISVVSLNYYMILRTSIMLIACLSVVWTADHIDASASFDFCLLATREIHTISPTFFPPQGATLTNTHTLIHTAAYRVKRNH